MMHCTEGAHSRCEWHGHTHGGTLDMNLRLITTVSQPPLATPGRPSQQPRPTSLSVHSITGTQSSLAWGRTCRTRPSLRPPCHPDQANSTQRATQSARTHTQSVSSSHAGAASMPARGSARRKGTWYGALGRHSNRFPMSKAQFGVGWGMGRGWGDWGLGAWKRFGGPVAVTHTHTPDATHGTAQG